MIDKINFFKKNGFVFLDDVFFNSNDLKILSGNVRKIFAEKKEISDKNFTSASGGFEGLKYITQYDDDIHNILNKFFSDNKLIEFLNKILGQNYKIWTINYRIANSQDRGLGFHQDSHGETNLTILLKDNLSGSGSTSFVSGSHLIKLS